MSDHGRFVVVPASYVFLLRDGASGLEVLLQLRQNTGYIDDHWAAAAAGHVERGETAYGAAHRGLEIGVRDLDLTFVTAMQRTRHADPIDERIDFFLTARSWSGEPRIVEPEKATPTCGGAPSTTCVTRRPRERSVLDGLGEYDGGRPPVQASERDPMTDLGPQPEPQIKPGEPNPGGPDAIDD